MQTYHCYSKWEDYLNGMYINIPKREEKQFLQRAIEFTGNAELYGLWMMKVILIWPNCCEHNLTNQNINRKAWIGHSACCMAIKCPEYITRKAWAFLSKEQQTEANLKAQHAIETWESYYAKKILRN